ncbi:MAG: endonuclease domain-containing protein [Spirochaetia bacterium]|nr:endonuclease domain-containing protein [Spirochaetia bacterium]
MVTADKRKVFFTGVLKNINVMAGEILWKHLMSLRAEGIRFIRNGVVGEHVADYVCHESKVVLLLSGDRELLGEGKDIARSISFTKAGYRVLRVSERLVYEDINSLLEAVRVNVF